jgi:TP901 family phage tail tape measure protein
MPLGVREVLLILRAKDQASRVFADVGRNFTSLEADAQAAAKAQIGAGTALLGLGVASIAAGAGILSFLNSARNAAVEYNRQAALTLTQVDQLGVSLNDIKDIGYNVAKAIPVPFEQLQSSLYDIFSSMDVNTKQAQDLLMAFGKEAVAGQVSIQDAGRSTIAIMNALQIPISDVNHVLDVQFQLVRKGVGTFGEFATSIGRVLPSAKNAGQTLETLSGVMAFLTRNGLSTSQAATSAARAFDVLANPKFDSRLNAMGVATTNLDGSFRQVNDIVTDLGAKLADMTQPQRAAALQDLMKGAGNSIQARRFFDVAVTGFDQLNALVKDMHDASGTANAAYNIMFNQPASQAQLFANRLAILKTQIGDALIPIWNKMLSIGNKILQFFINLSPHTKELIARIAALVGIFLVVFGIIMVVVGGFMIFQGVLALLGLTVSGFILIILGVLVVIALLALAAYEIYKHWDTIGPYFRQYWADFKQWAMDAWVILRDKVWPWMKQAWSDIKQWAGDAWQILQQVWDDITTVAVNTWHALIVIWHWLQQAWADLRQWAEDAWQILQQVWADLVQWAKDAAAIFVAVWDWVVTTALTLWNRFGPGIMKVVKSVVSLVVNTVQQLIKTFQAWSSSFTSGSKSVGKAVVDIFNRLMPTIRAIINFFVMLWPYVVRTIKDVWDIVVIIIKTAWEGIKIILQTAFDAIMVIWHRFAQPFLTLITDLWNLIASVIADVIGIIQGIIQVFLAVISGRWGDAWDGIKKVLSSAWNLIKDIITKGIGTIIDFLKTFPRKIIDAIGDLANLLVSKGQDLIFGLFSGLLQIWFKVWNWLSSLPGLVLRAIGDLAKVLWDAGAALIQGLWDGMKSVWDKVTGWLSGLGSAVIGLKGPYEKDLTTLYKNGTALIKGLQNGMEAGWVDAKASLAKMAPELQAQIGASIGVNGFATGGGLAAGNGNAVYIQPGAVCVDARGATAADASAIEDAVYRAMDKVLAEAGARS